jgi:hypothetical protein
MEDHNNGLVPEFTGSTGTATGSSRKDQLQVKPRLVSIAGGHSIEVSVTPLSDAVRRELVKMFPTIDCSKVVAVPTCQRATVDLVAMGPLVEAEKDRLLESFMSFASQVSQELMRNGYFSDYIDPCSGLPVLHHESNCFYDEVSGMQTLLKYNTMNAGCCKVLLHPVWGSAVYPATIFTDAPASVVSALLDAFTLRSD